MTENVTLPLALTVSYVAANEEEEAAAIEHEHQDHNGWAVVRLNGGIEVARLRVGYVDWCDGGVREPLEQAVADWLGGRKPE